MSYKFNPFTGSFDEISDITLPFFNGVFKESIDFLVDSDGATITGTLTNSSGGNLTMMFSDGMSTFTTPANVTLTAGTDDNPQRNYVYVLQSNKTLTVSTTSYPSTEHIKVADIVLRSATATQTEDALKNQNWNDHLAGTNNQGHMSHLAEAIRVKMPATWLTGVEGSCTVGGGGTTLDIATTEGKSFQLHEQTFPAKNTATGDTLNIVNNFTNQYFTTSDLETQTLDATGTSLTNSSFSFVLWGIINKTGEQSHLMINLPNGSYGRLSPDDAVNDAEGYSVYDIPQELQSVGFLIARFTFQLTAGGDWTLYSTQDLRGKIPNATAGGGGGGGSGATTFLGLSDTPSAYSGTAGYFLKVASGETGVEFVPADSPIAHAASHVDGTDDIQLATNIQKGLASASHIQDIETNNAKVSNATHTGDVTGSTELTIANEAIEVDMINSGGISPSDGDFLIADSTKDSGMTWYYRPRAGLAEIGDIRWSKNDLNTSYWVRANGRILQQSTFPDLFAVIGLIADGSAWNWSARTSSSTNQWVSVCWSEELNLFCAVSYAGTGNRVQTSPDGITWTAQTSAADNNWYGVCASKNEPSNKFVAVGGSGTNNRAMYSNDGITWNTGTSAADNDWRAVTHSPELGMFCAVARTGTGNRVMTSSDGITWTIRTSANDRDWRSICWSKELGLFCAASYSATTTDIMTSPDGITWTAQTTPIGYTWTSICWSPELHMFCAVALNASATACMTSQDGITWTLRTIGSNTWRAVTWSQELNQFCAVTDTGNAVATSYDGIFWTVNNTLPSGRWVCICWSPYLNMYCCGSITGGTTASIATSLFGYDTSTEYVLPEIESKGSALAYIRKSNGE